MKRFMLSLALLLVVATVSAQHIGYVEPLKYEKRDGQLKLLSYVKLSTPPAGKITLFLNDTKLAIESAPASDSLLVWLPMIGQQENLKITCGGKTLCKMMIEAPINSDWGYFKRGTIHIIQSSHQDIAWMNTPQYCREERIQEIITPALDMMAKDADFTFEMEQTLNLMEYLEAHPERKNEIIERYKEGRFFWGATYNQPYEGLSSGEQLVRQAYYGRKWVKENLPGCDDLTANNIDVPGRTMQMPQIFAKSGIKNLSISRMREGLYNWYSPDGSKVFTYTPGNYGWATLVWKFFDKNAVDAMSKLHSRVWLWNGYFAKHNIPPHYAILMSCDATKPRNFAPIIQAWNAIADVAEIELPRLRNSTAEQYFACVNVPGADFEQVTGERPDLWLYIHGPAHYQQTVAKRESGITLPAAEMFSTISRAVNSKWDYNRALFDRAWMASIYPDHGLGGKNGEITDSIFTDSLKIGQQLGEKLLHAAFDQITEQINTPVGNLVVYNDLTWSRNDVVLYEVADASVEVQTLDAKRVPQQLVERGNKCYLAFLASEIPSLGYKTYQIVQTRKTRSNRLPDSVTVGDNYYENPYYKVVLGNGGVTSLFDKVLNKEIVEREKFACGDVLEVGYKGNGAGEFNRVTDLEPGDLTALSTMPTRWKIVDNGAICTTFENRQTTKNATIIQRVTLYHALKKMDFDVAIENFNGAHNRQYRILFPADMKTAESTINYEVPMGVLEVGKHEMKTIAGGWSWGGTYTHHPADTHPREIQNFISANGNGFGLTLASGVAVGDWIDPSREQADYPMLQGILLSSHKSCHGEGNWYHQTGSHDFHFSLLSHAPHWTNGYKYGIEANHPLRYAVKRNNGGSLPTQKSFVSISDPLVAITTLKKADGDDHVIIRLTEMEGIDKTVTITLPFQVKRVVKTNMIEDEQETVAGEGQSLTFKITHHSIDTYKLIL